MKKAKTVELHEVRFTKDTLAKMNKKERDFLLVMGHIANDLNVAHRLALFSGNYSTNKHVVQAASVCQNLMTIRVLIGLMREAWTFIARELLHPPLLKLYVPTIEHDMPDVKAALANLKNYFQGTHKRNITDIRHDFAFHYPSQKWNLETWSDAGDRELVFHVSKSRVNSFYELSFAVATRAMLSRVSPDPEQALGKIMDEAVEVSGWLLTLTHAALAIAVRRHGGEALLTGKRYDVPARSWGSVSIPWFVTGKWRRHS